MRWFSSKKDKEIPNPVPPNPHPDAMRAPADLASVVLPTYQPPPLALLSDHADDTVPSLRDVIMTTDFLSARSPLSISLGMAEDRPIVLSLETIGHLLIAGAPPVSRDAMIHAVILSFLFRSSPNATRMVFLDGDPVSATLSPYEPIPHLLVPVVTIPHKIMSALRWAVQEAERRKRLMTEVKALNIQEYNQRMAEQLPFVLIVLHEFVPVVVQEPDMVEIVTALVHEGADQGIHLLVTTQLPETTTLSTLFPSPFKHQIPAKLLWGGTWATRNEGQPWILHLPHARLTQSFQGIWVSPREAARVADYFSVAGEVSAGALVELDALSGTEFESVIQTILHNRGWQLDLTPITGDFGADLIGRGHDGASWVIQAKRWKGAVGIEAVQQVLGAQAYYQTQKALLITTATLTKAAQELAQHTQVTVWTRNEIAPLYAELRDRDMAVFRHDADIQTAPPHPSTMSMLDFDVSTSVPNEVDNLFPEAVHLVTKNRKASPALLQRYFRIGYTQAVQLIDAMQERGFVGPSDGTPAYEVRLTIEQFHRLFDG